MFSKFVNFGIPSLYKNRKIGDLIMSVFEKVQEIIVEELGKEASEITLETSFESLDADSLDIFQIINERWLKHRR